MRSSTPALENPDLLDTTRDSEEIRRPEDVRAIGRCDGASIAIAILSIVMLAALVDVIARLAQRAQARTSVAA